MRGLPHLRLAITWKHIAVNLQNLLHRSSLFRFGNRAPSGQRRWDEPAARKLHVEQHSDSLSDHAKIPACPMSVRTGIFAFVPAPLANDGLVNSRTRFI